MKLLVVSNMFPSKAAPGYGTFVKNFCTQLEQLQIDYRLAVMKKAKSKPGKLAAYVGFYLKSFFASLFGRYDAVYVHYASHSSPGVLLARKLRKFTIYTNCHGSDVIPQNKSQEKMQKHTRAILAKSEKIIVPSDYFRRVVTEKYGVESHKLKVNPSGGVDTNLFSPNPCKKPPFTIGFVSRLISGKGWDVLLKACALLPDRDFRILLVGGGPDTGRAKELAKQLGLESQVEFAGEQPQAALPGFLNQMDVFVFPTTLAESLGLVAVEAMACGIPVVASDNAAPADYVEEGVNGYKFPVGDSEALAQALIKFRALPEDLQAKLQKGALETASKFDRATVTQNLKSILEE